MHFFGLKKLQKEAHVGAQAELARLYETGRGTKVDNKKAISYYMRAAKKDNLAAQYYLAIMYYDGRGSKKDMKKAKMWMKKCARAGDADAKAFIKKYKW